MSTHQSFAWGFWLQCLALLQPQEIAGRDPPRASIRQCEANPGVRRARFMREMLVKIQSAKGLEMSVTGHPQRLVRGSRDYFFGGCSHVGPSTIAETDGCLQEAF